MILWLWKHMYHKKQWWRCERVHPMNFHIILLCCIWLCLGHRDDFVYAPSQWETTLQCNIVSDWLCAYTISFIPYLGAPSNQREMFCVPNFFRLLHWDQGNHIVSEATLNNIGDCLHLHLQDIYIYIFNHSKTNYNQTMCILYGVYSMPDVPTLVARYRMMSWLCLFDIWVTSYTKWNQLYCYDPMMVEAYILS